MILKLVQGKDATKSSPAEKQERIKTLRETVSHYMPEFVKAVTTASKHKGKKVTPLALHQDSFAAGYDYDEYVLLGLAVKFAGLHGVDVWFLGRNHETF